MDSPQVPMPYRYTLKTDADADFVRICTSFLFKGVLCTCIGKIRREVYTHICFHSVCPMPVLLLQVPMPGTSVLLKCVSTKLYKLFTGTTSQEVSHKLAYFQYKSVYTRDNTTSCLASSIARVHIRI